MYKYIFFLSILLIFILSFTNYYNSIELFKNHPQNDLSHLDNMSSNQIKLFRIPDAYVNAIKETLSQSDSEEDKKILADFEANFNKDRSITSYNYDEDGNSISTKKNYNYFNEIDLRINKPKELSINMDSLRGSLKSLQKQVDILVLGNEKKNILGNEYLIKAGKCKIDPNKCSPDDNHNCIVDKYTYVNNIPSGHPLSLFPNKRGLIPGLLESIITFPIDKIGKSTDTIDVPYCDNNLSTQI